MGEAGVLGALSMPAFLSLAPPLVDAVWLAEALAAALVAAIGTSGTLRVRSTGLDWESGTSILFQKNGE